MSSTLILPRSTGGYYCVACDLEHTAPGPADPWARAIDDPADVLEHLRQHQAAGDRVEPATLARFGRIETQGRPARIRREGQV